MVWLGPKVAMLVADTVAVRHCKLAFIVAAHTHMQTRCHCRKLYLLTCALSSGCNFSGFMLAARAPAFAW